MKINHYAFDVFLEFTTQMGSLCLAACSLSAYTSSLLRSDVLQSVTATKEAAKLWLQFIPHIAHLHRQSDSHSFIYVLLCLLKN